MDKRSFPILMLCAAGVLATRSPSKAQTIYWTEFEGHHLRYAYAGDSEPRTLIRNDVPDDYTVAFDPAAGQMYWVRNKTIIRSNPDGTDDVELLTLEQVPDGLALDLTGGKMYWADPNSDQIGRANLDGTGMEILHAADRLDNPSKIVVDSSRGRIYWTEFGPNRIRRANLDGSNVETFVDGLASTTGLAIDTVTGTIYYTVPTQGLIVRREADGLLSFTVKSGLDFPRIVYVDSTSRRLYWSDGNALHRSNLDGSGAEIVVSGIDGSVHAVDVDLVRGHVYYILTMSSQTGAAIDRTKLDGSERERLIAPLFYEPSYLAIDLLDNQVYFRDADQIARLSQYGQNELFAVATVIGDVAGIATNSSPETIYWGDLTRCVDESAPRIIRLDIPSDAVSTVASGLFCPWSVAIDDVAGKIYWSEVFSGISRANLDGSEVESVLDVKGSPHPIAFDQDGGKIYFSVWAWYNTPDHGGEVGRILRANLDGTELEELVEGAGVGGAWGIAIDTINRKMYWTTENSIYRANLDGSSVVEMFTGLDHPWGIAVDESSGPIVPETIAGTISTKNRFLSFIAPGSTGNQAVRVRFADLPAPFDIWNGSTLWVGEPREVSENGAVVDPTDPSLPPGTGTFYAATLECTETPHCTDWSSMNTIHLFHEGIVPSRLASSTGPIEVAAVYEIQIVDCEKDMTVENNFSPALSVSTAGWGDTIKDFAFEPPDPPDQTVNIIDALAVVGRFVGDPKSIVKARADSEPACLDLVINITDVVQSISAMQGLQYPFAPSALDPCESNCASPLP